MNGLQFSCYTYLYQFKQIKMNYKRLFKAIGITCIIFLIIVGLFYMNVKALLSLLVILCIIGVIIIIYLLLDD